MEMEENKRIDESIKDRLVLIQNSLKENLTELKRLSEIEDRLKLAIETHEVYLDAIEDDPYKGAIIEFTLDILRDIKGENEKA